MVLELSTEYLVVKAKELQRELVQMTGQRNLLKLFGTIVKTWNVRYDRWGMYLD